VWRKTVLICVDGLDPAYLAAAGTPNLDAVARGGFFRLVRSAMPSVTNVNNVSIVTGAFPEAHGIAGNYRYDPRTGQGEMIEGPEHLRAPTLFERAAARGLRGALLVTKDKLRRLLGGGAELAISAERPPPEWVAAIGPAEPIYSAQIDYWQLRALARVLAERDPDLVYCSTTDYVMHMHGPGAPEAVRHLERLDGLIGEVLARFPDRRVLIAADHGMADKAEALDLEAVLRARGIAATFVPAIKDRYVVHHFNMGGSGNVYLPGDGGAADAAAVLAETPGVEAVYGREEAAARFRLPPGGIGDLFVLGDRATVFAEAGSLGAARAPVRLRSHGGLHETVVPLWGHNAEAGPDAYEWNLDVGRNLGLDE